MADNTEVQDFYQDCEVLVTGGTGFLGKLTVEKVLRSCPGVRRVHLLVRPKKGLSVEQRKKILLDDVVFERMKREQPDSVEKIVFVSGDCSAPRLGLRDSDYHNLTQHVDIVLHLAATVRFDEKLKTAVNVNVKGTQEVTQLCREFVSLKAAVFVSTAYSNCHQQVIEEKLYDPPLTVEDTLIFLEKFLEHELVLLSEKIIRPWPNTYVFSKAIAENVVLTQGKGLPVVIVRPSIVLCTIKEPLKGWIDNMYGPIVIAVGIGSGILRVTYSNETGLLDMVPGDIVTNCIITSALTANNRSQDEIPVYNITSASNSVIIRNFTNMFTETLVQFPFTSAIWYPYVFLVNNYKAFMFLAFFLHFLPGFLLDLVLKLLGKPQIILNIYKKIQKHSVLTNYFTRQNWTFIIENTTKLYERLSPKDKKRFAFDTRTIHWEDTLLTVLPECRKYLLNETLDNLDDARSKYKKFYIAHTLMKIILWGMALYTCQLFTVKYLL